MPSHHPRIIARRHQKHADDRQEIWPTVAIVALLASGHTAIETVRQIVIANSIRVFSDWGGRGQATFSLVGLVGRLWV